MDGCDARAGPRRRARRSMGQPRVRIAVRSGDRIRREERLSQRRFRLVPLSHHRLRPDVDEHRRRPPRFPINVVMQDRRNRQLLIVGSDIGVFASIDGGGRWFRLKANLPDVAVHDLMIHPRENNLVIATYGRALLDR